MKQNHPHPFGLAPVKYDVDSDSLARLEGLTGFLGGRDLRAAAAASSAAAASMDSGGTAAIRHMVQLRRPRRLPPGHLQHPQLPLPLSHRARAAAEQLAARTSALTAVASYATALTRPRYQCNS